MEIIKALGALLMVGGIGFALWWLTAKGKAKATRGSQGMILAVCFVAVLVGFACVLEDRVTELTIRGVGTIRAATQQAVADAQDVAKLKTRVENQSATVDLIASQATKATELSETAAIQIKQAEQKLALLNDAITEAKTALNNLRQEEEFTIIVLSAQNDDRLSFDKLQELAAKQDYRFAKMAGQAWNTVFDAHNSPMSQSGFTIPWASGVNPSKMSLSMLSALYQSGTVYKPALLEYIWGRSDIPKLDRLDFLMSVMKTDPSLTAAEYAGRYFTAGTDQKIKPLALFYLAPWWDLHRHDFAETTTAAKP